MITQRYFGDGEPTSFGNEGTFYQCQFVRALPPPFDGAANKGATGVVLGGMELLPTDRMFEDEGRRWTFVRCIFINAQPPQTATLVNCQLVNCVWSEGGMAFDCSFETVGRHRVNAEDFKG